MPPTEPVWQTALAVWAMRGRGAKPLADLPIEFLRRHVVLPPARSLSRSGAGEKLSTSCPSEIGAPFRLVCEVFLLRWRPRWGGIWWPVKQCLNRKWHRSGCFPVLVKDLEGVCVHLADLARAGTDLGPGQFQTLKLGSD